MNLWQKIITWCTKEFLPLRHCPWAIQKRDAYWNVKKRIPWTSICKRIIDFVMICLRVFYRRPFILFFQRPMTILLRISLPQILSTGSCCIRRVLILDSRSQSVSSFFPFLKSLFHCLKHHRQPLPNYWILSHIWLWFSC